MIKFEAPAPAWTVFPYWIPRCRSSKSSSPTAIPPLRTGNDLPLTLQKRNNRLEGVVEGNLKPVGSKEIFRIELLSQHLFVGKYTYGTMV